MAAQPTVTRVTTRRAGAASHGKVDWHAIDWRQANRNVRRLQARIVQATQDGRWGKANVEVMLALLQSAGERREITLQHQVAILR